MPGGDGSGPLGFGPMTGRGAGYCAGFNGSGYAMGRGYGFGFRRFNRSGFPCRFSFYSPAYAPEAYPAAVAYPAADEEESLKAEANYLESQLKQIKKRLEALREET